MANSVIIFGPLAVGKMTVGQELEKLTGYKLFHNHMTIELVANFFSYGSKEGKYLVKHFRQEIFETVAKSELPGLIFTFVCGFDTPEDFSYMKRIEDLFGEYGGKTAFVELEAELEVRRERNTSENRLLHKPTKRDIEFSTKMFNYDEKYRLNSLPGEINEPFYLRIDNTNLPPDETAKRIKEGIEWL